MGGGEGVEFFPKYFKIRGDHNYMKLRIKLRNYKMNHFQHIKSQIPTFLNLSFQEYQHVFCLESLARNSREEERLPYCKFLSHKTSPFLQGPVSVENTENFG